MEGAGHGGGGRFEPRVSVIIRSKDRLGELCELLGLVFSQTYTNFEVVVIDSTERATQEEWALVRAIRDPRLRIVTTPPRGCPAAANAGVLASQGEILVFIDDDDLPLGDEWLWRHVRNFRDPQCLGVNGYHVMPSEHRAAEASVMQRFRRRLLLSHGPFKEPYFFAYDDRRKVGIDYLMGGNSSIRRSAVLLGGGWDEYLDYHDEHSLFLRLNKRKPPGSYLVYDPEAKMEIRKNIPGGLDARFSGDTTRRVDTLAKYFLWTVGREHPGRIWGLAPLFAGYFAGLAAVAGYELAADRPVSRLAETLRGLAWSPISLVRHAVARRPAPHDGFGEAAATSGCADGGFAQGARR
ncbi:MAG: glycosyltransferase family 2 protein [Deltaproteobacteria bacterium]|nr:glycosyltransferase family 2 protein [Deltaproteobacteria bacterium]